MNKIVVPLSFKDRRAPLREKVERDADIMYDNARYVIVLDKAGNVLEQRSNRRFDDEVVDCLAVFAPFTYKGTFFERALVLEIGFRRFVPYAQTEHRLGAPTQRGPIVRFRKGEERRTGQKIKRRKKRAFTIKPRVPVIRLTDDAMFEIMPVLTRGIQECVDSIIRTWTKTLVAYKRGFWHRFDYESSILVRFPKEAALLCATASFADLDWRAKPNGQLRSVAESMRSLLDGFTDRRVRHRHRNQDGSFDDDFVRGSTAMQYVAEKLRTRIIYKGYSSEMVNKLLELVGPPESADRKLIEQIWRVYKVPEPRPSRSFGRYVSQYGEMKELLLERWLIQNYRSIRLEKKKRNTAEQRKEEDRPYHPHAQGCIAFSVFASKEVAAEMVEAYSAQKALQMEEHAGQSAPSNDTSWNSAVNRTGTDDIPS